MTSRIPKTSVRPMAISAYTRPMVTPLTTCCRRTAVTRGGRATSREPEVGHRAPVGDGDGVELEVQLLAEVEGHFLGTLGLDHLQILAEDDVLELLEHRLRLADIVVLPDHAITGATVR